MVNKFWFVNGIVFIKLVISDTKVNEVLKQISQVVTTGKPITIGTDKILDTLSIRHDSIFAAKFGFSQFNK